MQPPLNIQIPNTQQPILQQTNPTVQQPVANNQYPNMSTQQQPLINVPQPSMNEILTDPRYQSTRDSEILKTFELAKLTRDEAVLVLDKINNHQALEVALNKLKPFIRT